MATAAGRTATDAPSNSDLEADIRQLKADIEELTRRLAKTRDDGYGAARRKKYTSEEWSAIMRKAGRK